MSIKPNEEVIYVTKYALTEGILRIKARLTTIVGSDTMKTVGTPYGGLYITRKDWHETREEAEKRVRKMLKSAYASLEKKQRKLDALTASLDANTFKIVEVAP